MNVRDSETLTPILLGLSYGQLYLPLYDQTSISIREQCKFSQSMRTYFEIVGSVIIYRHYTLERSGINVEIQSA